MANRTQTDRGRRSEARERRRSRVSQPFEELDQAARSGDSEARSGLDGNLTGAAAKVIGTAVAAGLLGALGGAAKALLERREAGGETTAPDAEDDASDDKQDTAPEAAQAELISDEPEPQASETDEDEPDRSEPRASTKRDEEDPSEQRGVSDAEAGEIVSKARSQLESLLGTDVDRVSGLERSGGRSSVTLEVVEVARVPESTDVMATYEVALDEEGSLVSVNRMRRYRRSQVDGPA